MAAGITHDSHYVAQAFLRRWSSDGIHVHAYRVLVSRPQVPEWRLRPIRGLAFQPDLYTSFTGGQEIDEFERWITTEYENPGLEAVDKVLAGRRMTPSDWNSIARFVAAQDVRTPLNFIEFMRLCGEQMPAILDECVSEYQRLSKIGVVGIASKSKQNALAKSLSVRVGQTAQPSSGKAAIRVEAPPRKLWLASIRHVLAGATAVLCQHRWSLATPDGDEEWPITDHPVLRLNYYRTDQYDFRGGWGNKGSEILMPLSPRHLLYVQVGRKLSNRFTFSREHTGLVQRLIVERGHRWVFALHPAPWVARFKPRKIDAAAFSAEQAAWAHWHAEQSQAEMRLEGNEVERRSPP